MRRRTIASLRVRPGGRGHFGDAVLTKAAHRTVIFGGDVNRSSACAPERAWARSDSSGDQAPGLQGVYGDGALSSPAAELLPATHTDHDVLLVRAHAVLEPA